MIVLGVPALRDAHVGVGTPVTRTTVPRGRFGSALNLNLHFHALVLLHAKVALEADDHAGRERRCRYLARPPIASERLSLAQDGRVIYALRRPWKDGTRAVVFDPLDFIARLAALVPRPRVHLLTYHGVLAPAAQWRDWIVPAKPTSTPRDPHRSLAEHALRPSRARTRPTWAEL